MHSVPPGDKRRGICRYCEQQVFYGRHPDAEKPEIKDSNRYWIYDRLEWRHNHSGVEKCDDEADGTERYSRAEPRHLCMYIKGDGMTCYRLIDEQAQNDHLWACGIHMRQELEEQATRKRSAEYAAQREETEELKEWARQSLKQQVDDIKSMGLNVHWQHNRWGHPDTSVTIEIADLLEWLQHARES